MLNFGEFLRFPAKKLVENSGDLRNLCKYLIGDQR